MSRQGKRGRRRPKGGESKKRGRKTEGTQSPSEADLAASALTANAGGDAEAPKAPWDWAEIGKAYALLTLSAALIFLGFAGFGIWPLAFVGMVPAMVVFDGLHAGGVRPTGWRFFRRALFFGYVSVYGGFYWVVNTIVDFGGFPYALALLFASIYFVYQGLQFVLILWLWRRARERGFDAALSLVAAYVGSELAFPQLFDNFYGNSFHMLPELTQVADLGGPMLLTALAMMGSGAVYSLLRTPLVAGEGLLWKPSAAFAAALVFCLGYSAWRTSEVEARMAAAETIEVGVVQTNMGIHEKRDDPGEGLRRHLEQSLALEEQGPLDLLVWPESAATFALPRTLGVDVQGPLLSALRFYRVENPGMPTSPLLFGGLSMSYEDGERQLYNTAFITDADGAVRAHYDKTYLLGFGEYIPLGDVFPIVYELSPNSGHFTPGSHVRPLPLETRDGREFRVGTLVCYEDILPRFTRSVVSEGDPHVLVNITNDAWFGATQEPYIHLALAKMRAIEHHRYLVRATNTGVSAIIDPLGRTVEEGALFDRWSGRAEIAMLEGNPTIYGAVGDWPGWLALLGIVFMAFVGRRGGKPEPLETTPGAKGRRTKETRRGDAARRRDERERGAAPEHEEQE